MSNDRENEEEEVRRALLQEARDCLVTNGAPPVFITRMLELLDGKFSAEELSYARPPEVLLWPIITMVAAWIGGMVTAMLLLVFPNEADLTEVSTLEIILVSLAQIPFLVASALFLRSRLKRKSIEDDALAVYARLVPETWRNRVFYKEIRNKQASSVSEVDAYLRQRGWQGWSGARIWYLMHVLGYFGHVYLLFYLSRGTTEL